MSIATLEITGLKIGIAVAVLAGCCGATWFAADAHYSKDLNSLKGQLEGASMAQKAAVATQIKMDQDAAKEIDNAAKQQISSMADTIAYLSVHNAASPRTITLRPAPASAPIACAKPDRPAAAASSGPVREPEKPTPAASEPETAAIPADILDGVLTVGIDALKAELLWREYVRKTGQTK